MSTRQKAEEFVAEITKEYIRNGMFDGRPEPRLTERLTRDITKLLDGEVPDVSFVPVSSPPQIPVDPSAGAPAKKARKKRAPSKKAKAKS